MNDAPVHSARAAASPDIQVDTGITRRHAKKCGSRFAERCSCKPTFQAQAWSAHDNKPVRKTFKTLAAARVWRQEASVALRRREMNAPSDIVLSEAAASWVEAARSGIVRTRSGHPYKPSALRSYEAALRLTLIPAFGSRRLSAITRNQIQGLIDDMSRKGFAPSTIHNAVLPLRAIYRRAVDREEISVNPTAKLALPRDRRSRDRVAEPREIEALLAVLAPHHRVLWSTAVYAGLRRGELQALRWEAIDLEAGVLRVEHSWDRVVGLVSPKSRSGERSVPIPGALAHELREFRLRQGTGGEGFVFSQTGEHPFDPSNALRAARRSWAAAGLGSLAFHAARHTYASLMIAAGVNAKALSVYMGHSSIVVTIDRYGHLMPGNEREAAALLDGYLERDRLKHGLQSVQ